MGAWILECIEDKLGRDQLGALKRRSTVHARVSMTHLRSCSLDKGDSDRVLFIDYTKAFDQVDHTILLNKLISFDIPHCLVKWMFSFLKDRRQRVKINDTLSDWITLKRRQGTWLRALTFITLLDDLNPPCAVHKFVDDTTIYY